MENSILENTTPKYGIHDKLRDRSIKYNPIADLTSSSYDGNFENVLPEDEYSIVDQSTEDTKRSNSTNSLVTWLKDATDTFLNSRDNINLMSERGKLIKDILPVVDDIDYQLNFLDLKIQVKQAEEALNSTSQEDPTYSTKFQHLSELQSKLNQAMPQYYQILEKYGEKDYTDEYARTSQLLDLKESYIDKANEIKENIDYYNNNLKSRAEDYQISQEFRRKEQENQQNLEWKSIFKPDFWKYAAPNLLGSSFATAEAYAGSLGSAYIAQMGKTAALRSAMRFGGPQAMAVGEIAGQLTALAGIAGGVISNVYSRHRESLAQVEGAARQNMENILKNEYNVSLEELIPAARQEYNRQNPSKNSNDLSDNEIMERIITGEIDIEDERLDNVRKKAYSGLDNVYNNNMALSAMDMVETAMVLKPVGKLVTNTILKPIAKPLGKVAKKVSEPLTKKIDGIIDATIDMNRKWAYSSPAKKIASDSAKTLAKIGFIGLSEGYEEAQQDIFDYDYLKGKYDNESSGLFNSLGNYVGSGIRTTKILLGMNGDEGLSNDQQFWDDMIGGFALGIFMGGLPITATKGSNLYNEFKANKYVREAVADNIKKNDDMLKATIYTDKAVQKRQDQVLEVLEGFKTNPPEGLTVEDIEDEIARAKNIMSTANSENTKFLAKQAGITPGSKEYTAFVALNAFNLDNLKQAQENLKNAETTDDSFYSDYQNIPELATVVFDEDKLNYSTIGRLNIQKSAVDELINELKSIENTSKAMPDVIPTRFSRNAKRITSELKRLKKDIEKNLSELSNVTEVDPESISLGSKEEEGKKLYKQRALAIADFKDATSQYNILRGLKEDKHGNNIWYNKLSDADKRTVTNKINSIVNRYLSNLENNVNNLQRRQQESQENVEINKVESEPTVVTTNPSPTTSNVPKKTIYNTEDDYAGIKIGFPQNEEKTETGTQQGPFIYEGEEPKENKPEQNNQPEKTPDTDKQSKRNLRGTAINPDDMPSTPKKEEKSSKPTLDKRSIRGVGADSQLLQDNNEKKPIVPENKPVVSSAIKKEIEKHPDAVVSQDVYIPSAEEAAADADAAAAAMLDPGNYVNDSSSSVTLHKVTMDGMPQDVTKYSLTNPIKDQDLTNEELTDKSIEISRATEAVADGGVEDINQIARSSILDDIYANMGNTSNDKVSHTFFYAYDNEKPLETDAKSGKELSEFLADPKALDGADIYFDVVSWNGEYKPGKPETYDSAAVRLIIKKNGNKYILSLKEPTNAKILLNRINNDKNLTGKALEEAERKDKEAIQRLEDYRNSIIRAFEELSPNKKLIPTNISRSNGFLKSNKEENGRSIQRPIQEIKGFNIPQDPYQINSDTVDIGIGGGALTGNTVVDKDGQLKSGKGGSGTIYIYPKASSTPSGTNTTNVQVQLARFNDTEANAIYSLITKYNASEVDTIVNKKTRIDTGISAHKLLTFMVRFGPRTIVSPQLYSKAPHLYPKQFNLENNILTIGNGVYDITNLTAQDKTDIINYIKNTMHWRVDKSTIFGNIDEAFPEVKLYFENHPEANELEVFKDFKFERGQFGLTEAHNKPMSTLGWYINKSLIRSDASDTLFHAPFLYAEGLNEEEIKTPIVVDKPINETNAPKKKTSIRGNGNPFMKGLEDFGAPKKYNGPYKETLNSEEVNWLRKKLGISSDSISVVDKILDLTKAMGIQAMGLMRADNITLFSGAERGTAYHEAFHRVSLLLLSPEERRKLYAAYKAKTNFKGTDLELEENLADEFMGWKLHKSPMSDFRITKFFKSLYNYIVRWNKFTDTNLSNIFSRIEAGYYANKQFNKKSLEEFYNTYPSGAPFTYKGHKFKHITNAQFDEAVNSLVANLFSVNNISTSEDLSNLNFEELQERLNPDAIDSYDITDQQKLALKEIGENFDNIFLPLIKQKLNDYQIRVIDRADYQDERAEAISDGNEVGDALAQHILNPIEVSKKDNALGITKIFMATIPEATYDNGKLVPVVSEVTGLPKFTEFNKTWNTILNNLHDCKNWSSLLTKVGTYAKQYPFFASLKWKLNKVNTESLQTQIINTVSSAYHNLIDVIVSQKMQNGKFVTTGYINDSNFNRAIKVYPDLWNSLFLDNTNYINRIGDKLIPNASAIKTVISDYNRLSKLVLDAVNKPDKKLADGQTAKEYVSEKLPHLKDLLLKLLGFAGIDIDIDSLNDLIIKKYHSDDSTEAFNKMLSDTKGISILFNYILQNISNIETNPSNPKYGIFTLQEKQVDINKLYSQFDIIKQFAQSYAMRNPNPEELSVVSTDGKLLYPISAHNYMSDMIQYLNTDPSYANEMATVMYNSGTNGKGSKMLSHIIKGGKLQLNTLVTFKKDNSSDNGRKYLEISPVEDYFTKMVFTRSDHITMPTMGDSGTYNTISGMKLFHKHLLVNNKTNQLKFDDDVLEQFANYFLAEVDTIKLNYENIEKINETNAIKNYHTGNRNGYRFRYFDGLLIDKEKNFNDALKLAEQVDLENNDKSYTASKKVINQILTDFISLNSSERYNVINRYLKQQLLNELEYANELGLISFNGFKQDKDGRLPIKNLLLDSNWVNNSTRVYKNSSNEYAKKNAEAIAIVDIIAEHLVNTMVSIEEVEKVFIKDPAYYKDTVDKIKRLREVLSTGTTPRTQFDPGNELNDFTQVNVGMLSDNEIPSRQFTEIKDKARESIAIQMLIAEGKTEQEAEDIVDSGKLNTDEYKNIWDKANDIAQRDFNGYGEVNQTDATVLISPEMYKQLVRRVDGWEADVEEAFNLLNDPEAKWESDPEAYSKALGVTMKPLKMMYFGDHYNHDLKLNVPVFDKMAMFPVHRIFSKGDLGALLQRMEDPTNPIHMVAFESAVKVGQGSKTSYYLDKENKVINVDGLNSMITRKQDFKFFRRQLITDPHHASEQMFVSQAQKALMGNIRDDRTYTDIFGNKYNGSEVKENIYGAINALTKLGRKSFSNEFGVKQTEDGYSVSNEKISEVLTKDAESSNMNQNVLEGLQLNEKGQLLVPLSGMSDSSWIESRIVSLANKRIIDIRTPGGMFIQMSSFTYNSIAVNPVSGRKRSLNFVNEDGSMDAVISINLLKHIIPNYDSMSFNDAVEWLTKHKVIGDDAKPVAIGYRIPAQGQSSTAALKIVDVYPEQIGDTITLPDEFTKLTGSDFDIDKLFVARYNFDKKGNIVTFNNTPVEELLEQKLIKKEEELRNSGVNDDEFISKEKYKLKERYKNSNAYDLNSEAANQNLLLSMYMSVITNKYNFAETRLPLDTTTDTLKNEYLADIDNRTGEGKIKPYSMLYYLTPQFQSRTKNELSGGKAGIAPFALNSAHHSLGQTVNLKFNSSGVLTKYGLKALDGIFGRDGVRILDWLSAMINAHVDVAKDPWIMRLNVVQYTYNMTNFLLRSGVGKSTFYFLPQSILKDISKNVAKFNGKFGVNDSLSRSALEKSAIDEVVKDYADKLLKLSDNKEDKKLARTFYKLSSMKKKDINAFLQSLNNTNSLNFEYLQEQLTRKETPEWYKNQLFIYATFAELTPYAEAMSNLVNLSQIDTKKFGNNFGLHEAFLYRLKDFIANDIFFQNAKDIFSKTFLLQKIKDGIVFPRRAFENVFVRTSTPFSTIRSEIFALTDGLGEKDDSYINNVTRGIEASYKSAFFNKYIKQNGIDLKDLMYGPNSVGKRLYRIKKDAQGGKYPELLGSDGKLSNLLLEQLNQKPKLNTTDLSLPDFIKYAATKNANGNIDNMLIRAWDELLDNDNAEVRKFAEDLVIYAFYTSGDSFGANTIFKYVPNSYKEKLGYFDFVRELESQPEKLSEYFSFDNFFRNNWYNEQIVPTVELSRVRFDRDGEYTENVPAIYTKPGSKNVMIIDGVEYTYPLIFTNTFAAEFDIRGVNRKGQFLFAPFVKIKLDPFNINSTLLYEQVGVIDGKPVYILTNKKGVSYQGSMLSEYTEQFDSIIDINNPLKSGELTTDKLYSAFRKDPYFEPFFEKIKYGDTEEISLRFSLISDIHPSSWLLTDPLDVSLLESVTQTKQLTTSQNVFAEKVDEQKPETTNTKQTLFSDLKQVRINVPNTLVSVERAKSLINTLRKEEAKGGDLDSYIEYGEMLTEWMETKAVANLFKDKTFASDVEQILKSYIEKHPDLLGTDFSELGKEVKLSNILEKIVEDSGAFVKEDKNQLNLFDDVSEFPTDEINHCIK